MTFNYDAPVDGELRVRIDSKATHAITTITYEKNKKGIATGALTTPVSRCHDVNVYAYKRTKSNDFIIDISNILFEQ